MTYVFGATLAAGILLMISPWVWPRRPRPTAEAASTPVRRLLETAGYAHVPARMFGVVTALAAAVAASTAWLVIPVPVLAIVGAAVGSLAPLLWLRARRLRLLRTRRGLWPDVCDLLIASVRAGMSLPDALTSLASSAPGPLRPAFGMFAGDVAASGHFESSVSRLKSVLADPIADRILETLRMARQVGGTELVPVLRALATSVRADTTLRAEVEARQSWIRGAAVLGVVAPWAILALLAMRPEGAKAYNSPEGMVLVVVGALVSFVAYRIMVRIGRLPESRRWFG